METNSLVAVEKTTSALALQMEALGDQARDYITKSKSDNTKRAYDSDWTHFYSWCNARGLEAIPASVDTVALYITDLAGEKATSTVMRRLASISVRHQASGFDTPTDTPAIRTLVQGIKRVKGTAPTEKKPITIDDVKAISSALALDTLTGARNHALLLIGFAGAMRRSELAALDVEDLSFTRQGLTIRIKKSKADQTGEGEYVGLPYGSDILTCPVRAAQAWLEMSGITEGPVFRPINRHGQMSNARMSGAAVGDFVKSMAAKIGKDASEFGGHSLRSGLATSAAAAGVSERSIMQQGRWKSLVVRRYVRHGSLYIENAAAKIGL